MDYNGKIVLVTGSSRGIGLEITKHFLECGASVIGISRSASDFKHRHYTHFELNLGDTEAILHFFKKQIQPAYAQIDIVINNAAVLTSQHAMIMPAKNAIDMVNVNLLGTFFISREAAKLMRKQGNARIINISSMTTSLEPVGESIYAACKSGMVTMNNILAKELSSYGITCNTLSITAYETDMLNQHSDVAKEKIKALINNLPIPRIARKEDIFNVIDFFASPNSSYITAQTIFLGGIN